MNGSTDATRPGVSIPATTLAAGSARRLICALARGAVNAVPERFQIWIVNPRPPDGVRVNRHGYVEPVLTFVQPPQLSAVAGEVVGDRPDLREFDRHGQQLIERLLRAFQLVQSKGALNPRFGPVRSEFDDRSMTPAPLRRSR